MALSPLEIELQYLIKQKKLHLDLLKNGIRIRRIAGADIEDLMLQGTAARVALARHFLESAGKFIRSRPPLFRNAISRSYYAMYHAARGVAYVTHFGDDNEAHATLHNAIPNDFPDADRWKNAFKDARLLRNEADYEPYPLSDSEFAETSRAQFRTSTDFFALTEVYLRAKGCIL